MAVSKQVKETIAVTIDEVFKKMNSISWLERQKAMKEEAFKNTEKILYCFNILKEHVADEKEYIDIAKRGKSCSVVRYSKNKSEQEDEDQLLKDRIASYQRSKSDVDRIETFEEIAEILGGQQGYNDNLNEKTVRGYKNTLIHDMAIFLFGSDAI